MRAFERIDGIAAPLPLTNVDTDKIVPARFLKTTERSGLGEALFDALRRDVQGAERPQFILNQAPWRRAAVLVTLDNFGCGSSREHAVWALTDFGIRAIVAPSFADIFYGNCIRNGLLPALLPLHATAALLQEIARPESARVTIDLHSRSLNSAHARYHFSIDSAPRRRLLNGLDEIAVTLGMTDAIERFEAQRDSLEYQFPPIRADF